MQIIARQNSGKFLGEVKKKPIELQFINLYFPQNVSLEL